MWIKKMMRIRAFSLTLMVMIILSGAVVPVSAQTISEPYVSSRLAGQDQYQTSVVVAEAYNNSTCDNVILASGNDFPDALSASILSKKLQAPILLVGTTATASNEDFNYISAHVANTGTVYIIGGTSIIGTDFETKLTSMGYSNIKRFGGTDRYDTNMLIVNDVNVPQGTPVFIASGENFPDALSVSSFSGSKQYPTLLVGANYFPDKTKSYITKDNPSEVYITGGTSVVSQDMENQIKSLVPGATVTRLAGDDCFGTNATVLNQFSVTPQTVYLANGNNFPDALAGSALAAKTGDPILLVNNQVLTIPYAIQSYLQKLHDSGIHPNVQSLGGRTVVPDILIREVENTLDGKSPTDFTNIAGGDKNGYYLDSSGHVWVWGKAGWVTTKSTEGTVYTWGSQNTPVQKSSLTHIIAIAAGQEGGACALDTSGHVWAWGNLNDPLDGHVNLDATIQVSNLSNIVAVAGGGKTGYALDSSGHVWAWGWGVSGELGNGKSGWVLSENKPYFITTPVQVSDLTNIIAITGGDHAAYALDSSGHVWAWGNGGDGELGNGTSGSTLTNGSYFSATPVQVSNLSNIIAIAGGFATGYALDNSGHVWTWGDGGYGELGNGKSGFSADGIKLSPYFTTTPVQVSDLTNIIAIDGGFNTGYALDSSGHVWAWGLGTDGNLGNGAQNNSAVPVQVSNLADIVAIAGGSGTGYATDSSNHVWAWGNGTNGELGNGKSGATLNETSYGTTIPVEISNLPPN
ncbi:RCC1 domain-containing protein, alpha-tubulin suppressor [Desulfosporosinus acidiphilus SJ4]|uniref:RCC1 domain-containing protein, alpha-tubulin suppressor n=2 Tax=Desulfosporosinus TaxID=79206 RepID=I4DAZ2_DESAJ|nr:RCC1 domain-containing protein, alpha-tubulin suppressor [Desulfosporosinus acidiphilus SJ4]